MFHILRFMNIIVLRSVAFYIDEYLYLDTFISIYFEKRTFQKQHFKLKIVMTRPVDFVFNVKICKSGSNWRRVYHVDRLEFGVICKRWNIIWGAVTYFLWCLLRANIRLLQTFMKTVLLSSSVFSISFSSWKKGVFSFLYHNAVKNTFASYILSLQTEQNLRI